MSQESNLVQNEISFHNRHSGFLRFWHWITALTISCSIILVLLGSTMFRTRNNIGMVQEQLERKGIAVSKDQARAVAHEYSDKLWMAHKWVGYGLCLLIFLRIVIEISQSQEDRLWNKIQRAIGFTPQSPFQKSERIHFLSVKTGYLIFYFLFVIMGLTGLGLAFEDAEILKSIHEPIKEIHEFVQYTIYFYILVHLVGVIRADLGHYKGIVSGMIHKRPL